MKDLSISTSSNIKIFKGNVATSNAFVYTLDSSKISGAIYDCAKAYSEADRKYGHANEQECSVWQIIPWDGVSIVVRIIVKINLPLPGVIKIGVASRTRRNTPPSPSRIIKGVFDSIALAG